MSERITENTSSIDENLEGDQDVILDQATEVAFLEAPGSDEAIQVDVEVGANLQIEGLTVEGSTFLQDPDSPGNLVINLSNGGQVILTDFLVLSQTGLPPALTLADGNVISAQGILDLIDNLDLDAIATAAGGATGGGQGGGGAGFAGANFGDLEALNRNPGDLNDALGGGGNAAPETNEVEVPGGTVILFTLVTTNGEEGGLEDTTMSIEIEATGTGTSIPISVLYSGVPAGYTININGVETISDGSAFEALVSDEITLLPFDDTDVDFTLTADVTFQSSNGATAVVSVDYLVAVDAEADDAQDMSAGVVVEENLIENGDFEDGLSGWRQVNFLQEGDLAEEGNAFASVDNHENGRSPFGVESPEAASGYGYLAMETPFIRLFQLNDVDVIDADVEDNDEDNLEERDDDQPPVMQEPVVVAQDFTLATDTSNLSLKLDTFTVQNDGPAPFLVAYIMEAGFDQNQDRDGDPEEGILKVIFIVPEDADITAEELIGDEEPPYEWSVAYAGDDDGSWSSIDGDFGALESGEYTLFLYSQGSTLTGFDNIELINDDADTLLTETVIIAPSNDTYDEDDDVNNEEFAVEAFGLNQLIPEGEQRVRIEEPVEPEKSGSDEPNPNEFDIEINATFDDVTDGTEQHALLARVPDGFTVVGGKGGNLIGAINVADLDPEIEGPDTMLYGEDEYPLTLSGMTQLYNDAGIQVTDLSGFLGTTEQENAGADDQVLNLPEGVYALFSVTQDDMTPVADDETENLFEASVKLTLEAPDRWDMELSDGGWSVDPNMPVDFALEPQEDKVKEGPDEIPDEIEDDLDGAFDEDIPDDLEILNNEADELEEEVLAAGRLNENGTIDFDIQTFALSMDIPTEPETETSYSNNLSLQEINVISVNVDPVHGQISVGNVIGFEDVESGDDGNNESNQDVDPNFTNNTLVLEGDIKLDIDIAVPDNEIVTRIILDGLLADAFPQQFALVEGDRFVGRDGFADNVYFDNDSDIDVSFDGQIWTLTSETGITQDDLEDLYYRPLDDSDKDLDVDVTVTFEDPETGHTLDRHADFKVTLDAVADDALFNVSPKENNNEDGYLPTGVIGTPSAVVIGNTSYYDAGFSTSVSETDGSEEILSFSLNIDGIRTGDVLGTDVVLRLSGSNPPVEISNASDGNIKLWANVDGSDIPVQVNATYIISDDAVTFTFADATVRVQSIDMNMNANGLQIGLPLHSDDDLSLSVSTTVYDNPIDDGEISLDNNTTTTTSQSFVLEVEAVADGVTLSQNAGSGNEDEYISIGTTTVGLIDQDKSEGIVKAVLSITNGEGTIRNEYLDGAQNEIDLETALESAFAGLNAELSANGETLTLTMTTTQDSLPEDAHLPSDLFNFDFQVISDQHSGDDIAMNWTITTEETNPEGDVELPTKDTSLDFVIDVLPVADQATGVQIEVLNDEGLTWTNLEAPEVAEAVFAANPGTPASEGVPASKENTGKIIAQAQFADNVDGSETHTVIVTIPAGFAPTDAELIEINGDTNASFVLANNDAPYGGGTITYNVPVGQNETGTFYEEILIIADPTVVGANDIELAGFTIRAETDDFQDDTRNAQNQPVEQEDDAFATAADKASLGVREGTTIGDTADAFVLEEEIIDIPMTFQLDDSGSVTESITKIEVSGLPVGSKIFDGANPTNEAIVGADGTVDIVGWEYSSLKLDLTENDAADVSLNVAVTTLESMTGLSRVDQHTIDVRVEAQTEVAVIGTTSVDWSGGTNWTNGDKGLEDSNDDVDVNLDGATVVTLTIPVNFPEYADGATTGDEEEQILLQIPTGWVISGVTGGTSGTSLDATYNTWDAYDVTPDASGNVTLTVTLSEDPNSPLTNTDSQDIDVNVRALSKDTDTDGTSQPHMLVSDASTITFTVDSVPDVTERRDTGTVYEKDLADGTAPDSPEAEDVTATGNFFNNVDWGSDRTGATVVSVQGVTPDDDGLIIVKDDADNPTYELIVTPTTGVWTFTLLGDMDHSNNDLSLTLPTFVATVADGDGDETTVDLDITVMDDAPNVTADDASDIVSGEEEVSIAEADNEVEDSFTFNVLDNDNLGADGNGGVNPITVTSVQLAGTNTLYGNEALTDEADIDALISFDETFNMVFTNPEDYSGAVTVTYYVTDGDTDDSASTTLSFTVAPDADEPSLSVIGVNETEDTASSVLTMDTTEGVTTQQVSLNIQSDTTDVDRSETVEVTISGLPSGFTLNNGTFDATNNVWKLDATKDPADLDAPTDLTGLKILGIPEHWSGSFDLSVQSTATDGTNTDTANEQPLTLSVVIAADADAPTLNVTDIDETEDTASTVLSLTTEGEVTTQELVLDITSASTDTDGSETVEVTISGLPAGFELNNGKYDEVAGVWRLDATPDPDDSTAPTDLTDLKIIKIPEDWSGTFDLSVQSTATDGTDTQTANQDPETLSVTIAPDADTPDLDAPDAISVNEGGRVALNISASSTDQDGSETVTVDITGLPQDAILVRKVEIEGELKDITISPTNISLTDLNGLELVLPAGSSADFDLSVIATAQDGNDTEPSLEDVINVTVNPDASVETELELSVEGGPINEDGSVLLQVVATFSDKDGSETHMLSLEKPSEEWTLDPTDNSGWADTGTHFVKTLTSVVGGYVGGPTVIPPAHSSDDVVFTITDTVLDTEIPQAAETITLNETDSDGIIMVDGFNGFPTDDLAISFSFDSGTSGSVPYVSYGSGDSNNEFLLYQNDGENVVRLYVNGDTNNSDYVTFDVDLNAVSMSAGEGVMTFVEVSWDAETGNATLVVNDNVYSASDTISQGTPLSGDGVLAFGQELDGNQDPGFAFSNTSDPSESTYQVFKGAISNIVIESVDGIISHWPGVASPDGVVYDIYGLNNMTSDGDVSFSSTWDGETQTNIAELTGNSVDVIIEPDAANDTEITLTISDENDYISEDGTTTLNVGATFHDLDGSEDHMLIITPPSDWMLSEGSDWSVDPEDGSWFISLPENDQANFNWDLTVTPPDGSAGNTFTFTVSDRILDTNARPAAIFEGWNTTDYLGLDLTDDSVEFPTDPIHVNVDVKTVALGDGAIVSYAEEGANNAFLIFINDGELTIYAGESHIPTGITINDGEWHNIDVKLDSTNGLVVGIDGESVFTNIDFRSNLSTLTGNGFMTVGQEQDEIEGDFEANQAFAGQIKNLDIEGLGTWPLDGNADDTSDNGNNLEVNGDVTFFTGDDITPSNITFPDPSVPEQAVTAEVHVNLPPEILADSVMTIDEEGDGGEVLGTISVVDNGLEIENDETIIYTLEGGNDFFELKTVDDETVIAVKDGVSFDFEEDDQTSYTVTVTADDGTDVSVEKEITINVNDINEAPIAVADTIITNNADAVIDVEAELLANDTDVDGDDLRVVPNPTFQFDTFTQVIMPGYIDEAPLETNKAGEPLVLNRKENFGYGADETTSIVVRGSLAEYGDEDPDHHNDAVSFHLNAGEILKIEELVDDGITVELYRSDVKTEDLGTTPPLASTDPSTGKLNYTIVEDGTYQVVIYKVGASSNEFQIQIDVDFSNVATSMNDKFEAYATYYYEEEQNFFNSEVVNVDGVSYVGEDNQTDSIFGVNTLRFSSALPETDSPLDYGKFGYVNGFMLGAIFAGTLGAVNTDDHYNDAVVVDVQAGENLFVNSMYQDTNVEIFKIVTDEATSAKSFTQVYLNEDGMIEGPQLASVTEQYIIRVSDQEGGDFEIQFGLTKPGYDGSYTISDRPDGDVSGETSTASIDVIVDQDNLLEGKDTNDIIIGDTGEDVIIGGQGDDILTGGAGDDTFKYESIDDGHDIITDFTAGDVIDLDALFSSIGASDVVDEDQVGVHINNNVVTVDTDGDGVVEEGFSITVNGTVDLSDKFLGANSEDDDINFIIDQ